MSLYPASTQHRFWTFKDVTKFNDKLIQVNHKYITDQMSRYTNVDPSSLFLSVQEEIIVKKHYEFVMKSFCEEFIPKMPPYILSTSLTYFKRYYLGESVMNYHPEDILYTCVFLACKVEEFNVSISQFVRNIRHRNKDCRFRISKYLNINTYSADDITDIILSQELHLMSRLNYQLTVHNPYRSVSGFVVDIKTRYTKFNENLASPACDFIQKSLFTNVVFFFSPSQVALTAIVNTCNYYKLDLKGYIDDCLFTNLNQEQTSKIYETIKMINKMISEEDVLERSQVKKLLKKLQICRNPEHDYNSDIYKELQKQEALKLEKELIYEMEHDM